MLADSFLKNITELLAYYKSLGDKTFAQLDEAELFQTDKEQNNSIPNIVHHMRGNMLSRWTNFLTEDGEKKWRERDNEFEDILVSKKQMLAEWEEGWACLFLAISTVNKGNFNQTVYIRNEGHSIMEAMQRQLAHYAYHIGQIVFLGKQIKGNNWVSLSIPKGESKTYNAKKFAEEKGRRNFTERV